MGHLENKHFTQSTAKLQGYKPSHMCQQQPRPASTILKITRNHSLGPKEFTHKYAEWLVRSLMCQSDEGLHESPVRCHVIVHLGLNISSFAHNCGCAVNGSNTMAAI